MRMRPRRCPRGNIAEFAPALCIFFLIILFPMINLIGLGSGACVVALLNREASSNAGTATTYQEALTGMKGVADKMVSSGLGKFGKLAPVNGYLGCGTDLYIVKTTIATNATQAYGPNQPIAGTIDPDAQLFTYSTISVYNVGPFLPLGGLPFLGTVPGIGQAVRIKFTSDRSVEHIEGMGAAVVSGSGDGGITTSPAGTEVPQGTLPPGGPGIAVPSGLP